MVLCRRAWAELLAQDPPATRVARLRPRKISIQVMTKSHRAAKHKLHTPTGDRRRWMAHWGFFYGSQARGDDDDDSLLWMSLAAGRV